MVLLNDIWAAVLAFLQSYVLDLVNAWTEGFFGDDGSDDGNWLVD
mgnify:CR=1 FL=1